MYTLGNWQLRWLGHDSFQLTTAGKTIYIDPFQLKGGRQADYIFITHEHYDHFDKVSIDAIKNTNTVFIGPKIVTDQLGESVITLLPGENHTTPDFTVLAVPAYNLNKPFHPKADNKLGFILELDGKRLYHAGDTDLIPEMGQLGAIDVALLPVSGTYVMTSTESAEAVKVIKPKIAIPMHYGAIVGSVSDANSFADGTKDYAEIVILEKENPI